jgi:hypothetical protein
MTHITTRHSCVPDGNKIAVHCSATGVRSHRSSIE